MIVKLKILILLVALVALPMRGMAAVAMWHCAQDRHEMPASAQGHAEHAHAGADHDAPAEPRGAAPSSSCSACAACCVGGAVAPAAWSAFSLEPPGASVIAFVERGFAGIVPAQLERPPLARSL